MGHFLNWYDNISRQPLGDPFVSSVDSGNLIASLWSLKQGCLELMREPVLPRSTLKALEDHLAVLDVRPSGPVQKALVSQPSMRGSRSCFYLRIRLH